MINPSVFYLKMKISGKINEEYRMVKPNKSNKRKHSKQRKGKQLE